jgi:hypothetical protein
MLEVAPFPLQRRGRLKLATLIVRQVQARGYTGPPGDSGAGLPRLGAGHLTKPRVQPSLQAADLRRRPIKQNPTSALPRRASEVGSGTARAASKLAVL